MNAHHVPLRQSVEEMRLGKEEEEGGARRVRKKRGRGIKDRVDKSRGIFSGQSILTVSGWVVRKGNAKSQSYPPPLFVCLQQNKKGREPRVKSVALKL